MLGSQARRRGSAFHAQSVDLGTDDFQRGKENFTLITTVLGQDTFVAGNWLTTETETARLH